MASSGGSAGAGAGGDGTLYLVATPIGNLEDITLRALRVLKEADCVAAEDTRVTLKLLSHYGIRKPIFSYHRHSKPGVLQKMLALVRDGKNVALVCDAGAPGISDPGEEVVRACIAQGLSVVAIPGPSALPTALSLSGLSTSGFVFSGFLPRRAADRRKALCELARQPRTLVFFEAPHRLAASLKDMASVLGDRQAVVARELTKKFEEVVRGALPEIARRVEECAPKGEVIVLIAGAPGVGEDEQSAADRLQHAVGVARGLRSSGMPTRSAAMQAGEKADVPWRTVYRALLATPRT